MAKTRRPLTEEEREVRRAAQRELVRASIEQLRSSDRWQAYLKARHRFPNYSWRNVLLILHQRPTATRVAGFRTWLDLGYCVCKRPVDVPEGAWGIRIWARCEPSRKRIQAWRDAGADPDERPRANYKLVTVFAQDQVLELPPPATPASLEAPIAEISGDSHHELLPRLARLSAELGYTFTVGDAGPADGQCNPKAKTIIVSERLETNGRVVAGIHELAHALVAEDEDAPELTYAQGELIAESVAWCCAQTAGLDSSANSIPYLTSWAESAELDVLEQTAALTSRLADRIEATLIPAAEPRAPWSIATPEAA
jgi:N-terminal domain of anti-restriction factor ArdC